MDLGTDYCFAGVLLALLRSLYTRCLTGAWRDVVASISCLLARCLLNEKRREDHSCWQATTPARYDLGTFVTPISTPLQGRGDTITLAHSEGSYMQIHRRFRRKLNPSGDSFRMGRRCGASQSTPTPPTCKAEAD